MIFSNRDCNYPQPDLRHVVADAVPPLGHGRRARPTTTGIAKRVLRPDIYLEAMKEMGVDGEGRRGAEDHAVRRRRSTARIPEKYAHVVPDQQPAREH